MQKIIAFIVCILSAACTAPRLIEKESWREKYPDGLLGNDYGILTEEDLAINICRTISPKPFNGAFTPYPYWQCFPVRDVKPVCEVSNEDKKNPMAILAIVASGEKRDQEYLLRISIPLRSCQDAQKKWKQVNTGQPHVCISGSFTEYGENNTGKKVSYWQLDKYKTKKECVPYFTGCDLKKELNKGCILKSNVN